MNEILALLSVAGFATQRTLELLDPLFIFLSKRNLFVKWEGGETAAKTWLMGLAGLVVGVVIALLDDHAIPGMGPTVSKIVIALAISTGSNAANSLLKYGEYVKAARSIEPLPEVKITPTTVTAAPNAKILFLGSVSGAANNAVTWRVLEPTVGGTVSPVNSNTGEYTAPTTPGTYHVAAISDANPAATATATVTVK